uniref:Uncharacterized protein n=1 Tax=Setaria viridis TaxID=4556 RepID=A0A4U6T789_SETVI|nr:hypothetical protein SEVIR_9G401050v2 [Setaria viridis]
MGRLSPRVRRHWMTTRLWPSGIKANQPVLLLLLLCHRYRRDRLKPALKPALTRAPGVGLKESSYARERAQTGGAL